MSVGVTGRLVKSSWRSITILTKAQEYVVIPHNLVSAKGYTNINKPKSETKFSFLVSLDHDLTIAKSVEVITNVLLSVKEINKFSTPKVAVNQITGDGIEYKIVFTHDNPFSFGGLKSTILMKLWKTFEYHGGCILFENPTKMYSWKGDENLERFSSNISSEKIIKGVKYFNSLTKDEIKALAEKSKEHKFTSATDLVKQGDNGDSMFVVKHGAVSEWKTNGSNKQELVSHLGVGEYFGGESLFSGEKRATTVKSINDVTVLEIDKQAIANIKDSINT